MKLETEGVERIEALVLEENKGSRRVLEKSGLMQEGLMRYFTYIDGKYRNVCFYGIIHEDYSLSKRI